MSSAYFTLFYGRKYFFAQKATVLVIGSNFHPSVVLGKAGACQSGATYGTSLLG